MTPGELTLTVSPHLHQKGRTVSRGMRDVLIALAPAAVVAVVVFGMSALYVMVISMLTAGITEYLIERLKRRRPTVNDMSAMVTGLLFAFLLPPTTPWWVVVAGSFFAIAVGKELFGGLGRNVFNPALLARVALMFSPLSIYVSKYVEPFFWKTTGFFSPVSTTVSSTSLGGVGFSSLGGTMYADTFTSATPLSLLKSGKMLADSITGPTPVGATWVTETGRPALHSLLTGFKSGSIGEVCVLALLLGAAYLIYRRTIDWRIPAGILGSFLVVMLIGWNSLLYHLFSGGLILGAFFMATDWVTSPMTRRGKWVYAVGIGVFVALIRIYSPLPEGVAIAILHFNVVTLVLDRYLAQPRFGVLKKPFFNRMPKLPEPAPKTVGRQA